MNLFIFFKKCFKCVLFMLYRFFNLNHPEKKKIIIFGLPLSGKTSIIYFLKLGYLITTVRTLFINEETFSIEIKNDKNDFKTKSYEISLYEIGQQCSYNLIKQYSDVSDDLIYIVDSTQMGELSEARDDFIRIIYEFRFIYKKCKFLIFLNKQDSNGCLKSEEIIKYFALPKELMCRSRFVPCSTLSGKGLKEGIEWILGDDMLLELTQNK
ncbi:ADP-ribosylation factor, putative [Hepatocystis sp. ex Piliocolobus tephrosceles]|nr:ADP-ribosylation factor, putative [Hepatocystis sp. ex Piliocolobus tephrosceles]